MTTVNNLDWKEFRKYIKENYEYYVRPGGYYNKNFDKVFTIDEITFSSIILKKIAESQGEENFESINDALVREHIAMDITAVVEESKKFIFNKSNMWNAYFDFVWECKDTGEVLGYSYNPKIFIEALRKVDDVCITNWKSKEKQVWEKYNEIEKELKPLP